MTIGNRYLLAFGGHDGEKCPVYEMIRRYDHLKPTIGWKVLSIDPTRRAPGVNYGLISLADEQATSVLVFGGNNHGFSEESMTFVDGP